MATISSYLATQQVEVSRVPRASQSIVSAGQGIVAEAIGTAAGQAGQVTAQFAAIEAQKQAIRDSVTLAEMKGQLDEFEFNSAPDISKVQTIQDFKKLEEQYHKDWDRKEKSLIHGRTQRVQNQFKIYTELRRGTAKRAYRNKSRPMEKAYAIASIQKESNNRLKVNFGMPSLQEKHLEALINSYAGYLDPATVLALRAGIPKEVEAFNIQWLMNLNPERAMKEIDGLVAMDEKEKNTLRSQARAAIARNEREQATQLQEMRERTNTTMLTDFWDGKLTDPQAVTDALRLGYLDDTDAKYLREAMLNPDPPKLNLMSLAEVKQAIEDIGTGAGTRDDALSVLYANLDSIDPATGKSLVSEIFGEHDKNESEMKRESRDLMEELVRERDPISGMFTDDERQILGAAEAYLMFDEEIKKAAAEGKPLNRRDKMIKAIEIGRQMKKKIKAEEAAKAQPIFRPGLPPAGNVLNVNTMKRPMNMTEFDVAIDALPNDDAKRRYFRKWYKDVPKN